MTAQKPPPGPSNPGISRVSVLVARLMWFVLGPAILLGTLYGTVTQGIGWLSWLNAVYLIALALMVLGRWHEQCSGAATLATGEPATWDDFRRYVGYLLAIGASAGVAANAVGNHWMAE